MNHEGTYASEISCVTVLFSVAIITVLVHDFVCCHLDCVGSPLSHVPAVSFSLTQSVLYPWIIKASTYWAPTTCPVVNTLHKWPTFMLITIVILTIIYTKGIMWMRKLRFLEVHLCTFRDQLRELGYKFKWLAHRLRPLITTLGYFHGGRCVFLKTHNSHHVSRIQ